MHTFYAQKQMKTYTLQEIAEATGLTESHLVRTKVGPIIRILEVYYWKVPQLSPDGRGRVLTQEGFDILEDYLHNCGIDGTMRYEEWRNQIWNKFNKNPEIESEVQAAAVSETHTETTDVIDVEVAPLVHVERTEMTELDLSTYGNSAQHFTNSFDAFKAALAQQSADKGIELARATTLPLVESFMKERESILKQAFGQIAS